MEATDFRIGNYVCRTTPANPVIIPITSVHFMVLKISLFNLEILKAGLIPAENENWDKVTLKEISGIPITPDILKQFGFDIGGYGGQGNCYTDAYLPGLYLFRNHDSLFGDWEIGLSQNKSHPGFTIKYVHQLQNLYFALTGKELTLKK